MDILSWYRADSIAITLWDKDGGLWFASKWDGTKTVEQTPWRREPGSPLTHDAPDEHGASGSMLSKVI
jgi:hypothetical protein